MQEQYSAYPRALADCNGAPHKGTKSVWTDKLQARYNPSVVTTQLPFGWTPEVVVIDAMFMINTNPLKSIKTVFEYGTLLLKVFVMPYFQSHCTEVHLCFDNPKQQQFNPKQCEQERRDEACKTDLESHTHLMFTPHTTIPRPWQEYVHCRQCKRALIEALGLSYLQTARFGLYPGKKLVLSGCFSGNAENTAWVIAEGSLPQPEPMYSSSAQEADMNMWRHVIQSPAHCILVYSPDTDVYNIGLTLIQCTSAEVIVQNNVPHKEKRYLNLNSLFTALANNPDLAALPVDKLGNIMQTLYICSGCDYISYFSGIGRATFLKHFFQNAEFISSSSMPGNLSETKHMQTGFLAFIRLIGTLYFKKHLSAFVSELGFETPNQLYNSIITPTVNEKHEEWLKRIRDIISDRITSEEERVPSYTALWRHWNRVCWVSEMWNNSPHQEVMKGLRLPEHSGWFLTPVNRYAIEWESPEVEEQVRSGINFLVKGCSCKKSKCTTLLCSCRKGSRNCGPGCECHGCANLPITSVEAGSDPDTEEGHSELEDDTDDSSTGSKEDRGDLETEIITDMYPDEVLLLSP